MMRNTNEMEKLKNNRNYVGAGLVPAQKGITLIALIITIIVMLILVSVTISMAINGGLFDYAGKAVSDTENAINAEQTLANGEVKIGDTWYDSIDDYLAGVESVKSLQEKHEFKYYSSLSKAVVDVNNNTRANADADKENAVAGIYTEDGTHTVVLLKDATQDTRVSPSVDMTINLGGYTFTCSDKVGIDIVSGNITIDGKLEESTIQISNEEFVACVQTHPGSNVVISGGNYIVRTNTGKGAAINNYGNTNISNCNVKGYGNLDFVNTKIVYGVQNHGVLEIDNCNVMGTATAVFNFASLFVNGGIYEGFDCGGFDFSGNSTTAYVKNATIRECEMPEGYKSTDERNGVGFCIGDNHDAADDIKVYIDNCDIYGSVNAFLLNSESGQKNNIVYISNSTINTDKKIEIGNNTHKLFIGKGNNFTSEHTTLPEAVTVTEDVYIKEN